MHILLPDMPCLPGRRPCCSVMQKAKASEGLEQLAELMAQGKLRVHLDRRVGRGGGLPPGGGVKRSRLQAGMPPWQWPCPAAL